MFSQSQKAIELLHEAYAICQDKPIYIQREIRRCLTKCDYETASKLSKELGDERYKAIVDVVSSDNSSSVFAAIPKNIKRDMEVRQIVLEGLVVKKDANCAFLFDCEDVALPESLKLSNIKEDFITNTNNINIINEILKENKDVKKYTDIKYEYTK